jgi:hypothetical protein
VGPIVYYAYMRIVLIVQSLIILLGAYYVYTLTRTPSSENMENSNIQVEVRRETFESTGEKKDSELMTETNSDGVIVQDGANDLGMEFPVPDEGVLEVR